jgi:CDP-diacylglycerol--glycerol-3-phosphate 3-phosphatidyltransferase
MGLAMLLMRRRRRVSAGLFLAGVTTDVVDGRLARRFGTASPRGARLDSAADAAFVVASAVCASTTVEPAARPLVGGVAGIVAATRLATLLTTRVRFGSWSVAHTRLNKASGLGLAGVVALALVRGRMPIVALGSVALLAEVAAIEELAIVLGSPDYDADRASLLDRGAQTR